MCADSVRIWCPVYCVTCFVSPVTCHYCQQSQSQAQPQTTPCHSMQCTPPYTQGRTNWFTQYFHESRIKVKTNICTSYSAKVSLSSKYLCSSRNRTSQDRYLDISLYSQVNTVQVGKGTRDQLSLVKVTQTPVPCCQLGQYSKIVNYSPLHNIIVLLRWKHVSLNALFRFI